MLALFLVALLPQVAASRYSATFTVAAADGDVNVSFAVNGPWNEDSTVVIKANNSEVQSFDTPTGTALLRKPTGAYRITAEILDDVGDFVQAEGSLDINLYKLDYDGHLEYFLGLPPLGAVHAARNMSPPCEFEKERRIVVSLRTVDATAAQISTTLKMLDQQTKKPDAVYMVMGVGAAASPDVPSSVHVVQSIHDWGPELTCLLPLLSLERGCSTLVLVVDARSPPPNVMIARAVDAVVARQSFAVVGDAGVIFPGCFGVKSDTVRLEVDDVSEAWRGQRAHSLVDSRVIAFPRRLAHSDFVEAFGSTQNMYGQIGWDALSIALEHLDVPRVVSHLGYDSPPLSNSVVSRVRDSLIDPMYRDHHWKTYVYFDDPISLKPFQNFLQVYRAWYLPNYDIRSATMENIIQILESKSSDDENDRGDTEDGSEPEMRRRRPLRMLETGTSPSRGDCRCAGAATFLLDVFANFNGGMLFTIDLNTNAVNKVRAAVSDRTHVLHGNTLDYIPKLAADGLTFDFIYLDSLDVRTWPDDRISAMHHLRELAAAFPLIGPGTLVVVDDTLPQSILNPDALRDLLRDSDHVGVFAPRRHEKSVGKGSGVRRWMEEVLRAPRVIDGYQIGWLIPDDIDRWIAQHGGISAVQEHILNFQ